MSILSYIIKPFIKIAAKLSPSCVEIWRATRHDCGRITCGMALTSSLTPVAQQDSPNPYSHITLTYTKFITYTHTFKIKLILNKLASCVWNYPTRRVWLEGRCGNPGSNTWNGGSISSQTSWLCAVMITQVNDLTYLRNCAARGPSHFIFPERDYAFEVFLKQWSIWQRFCSF